MSTDVTKRRRAEQDISLESGARARVRRHLHRHPRPKPTDGIMMYAVGEAISIKGVTIYRATDGYKTPRPTARTPTKRSVVNGTRTATNKTYF
jgi:hypothetical protein